jgi:hypothetical protein
LKCRFGFVNVSIAGSDSCHGLDAGRLRRRLDASDMLAFTRAFFDGSLFPSAYLGEMAD